VPSARRSSGFAVPPLRIAERGSGGEAGYALLAVLWITVGITGLTLLISVAARGAIASSRNRIALAVASWRAAGCLAHARAVVTEALERERAEHADVSLRTWDRVDRILRAAPSGDPACRLDARPVGARVDVNASDAATLAQLFRHVGMPPPRADSVAALITSHKPYVDLRQLHLIPGLDSVAVLDSVLDVEPGPLALDVAPAAVLALLPGFTEETVRRVLDARNQDAPISTFHELSQLLSSDAPEAAARLPGVAVFQAPAWVVTTRATAGRPAVTAVLEVRVGRSESATAVGRRRSWIE